MFVEMQRYRARELRRREAYLFRSYADLARRPDLRRVLFFGSSNLLSCTSMDRQLEILLRGAGLPVAVLNLGSFGLCDSRYVVETTRALRSAHRGRPIDLVLYEVTPNEIPPIEREAAGPLADRSHLSKLVLDFEEGERIRDLLHRTSLPLAANLERLAAELAPEGCPVVVLDYEANVRDWSPVASAFGRPVGAAEAGRCRDLLARAILRLPVDPAAALADLDEAAAIDPDVALTRYLRGRALEATGRGDPAPDQHAARRLDLMRGRFADPALFAGLPSICRELGFAFVPVGPIVSRLAGNRPPGFDVFVDDVHYRPEVHFELARALAGELERLGWPAAGAIDREAVLAEVDRQPVFDRLHGALNLLLSAPSPHMADRIRFGLARLEEARALGADERVHAQYEIRFLLQAGLSDRLAGAVERYRRRTRDPLAWLLSPTPLEPERPAREGPPVAAEIEREIRAVLAGRYGVAPGPEDGARELQSLGLDSLAVLDLVLALARAFDVALPESDLVADRFRTLDLLRDFLHERLERPRHGAIARDRARARSSRRSRPATGRSGGEPHPVQEVDRAAWSNRSLPAVLSERFATGDDDLALSIRPSGAPPGEDACRRLSWRDLDRTSAAQASHLAAAGVGPGAHVLVLAGHGVETVAAWLGALRLGAVPAIGHQPSPKLAPRVFLETFGRIVERSAARFVLVEPDLEDLVRAALPARVGVLVAAAAGGPLDFPAASPDPDAPAILQHSSGTTGIRKGVVLSHRALLAHTASYARAIDLRADDRIVSWLPLYHDMGLVACLLLGLTTGIPATLLSPFDWVVAPSILLEHVDRERGTLVWMPNFAFGFLADRIGTADLGRWDLSSVRAWINCSEPVREESWRRFHERFSVAGVARFHHATCYAMAENAFAVSQGGIGEPVLVDRVDRSAFAGRHEAVEAADDPDALALPSSGRPVEGVRVRIVDEDGREIPDRRVGEIRIAGEFLAAGYHDDPEATAAAFADGWYSTGDLGYLSDGHLFVTGRRKDLVIVAGQNVYPHEAEEAAGRVRGVKPGRVVAFGIDDEALGTERLVVLAEVDGPIGDPGALRRQVLEALREALGLAGTEVHLLVPGTLRKSTSGKPSRAANRDLFRSGTMSGSLVEGISTTGEAARPDSTLRGISPAEPPPAPNDPSHRSE